MTLRSDRGGWSAAGKTILKEASTKGKPLRKDGTQSYGPSRQRSSYGHCDKGKPGVTRGRKATDLQMN